MGKVLIIFLLVSSYGYAQKDTTKWGLLLDGAIGVTKADLEFEGDHKWRNRPGAGLTGNIQLNYQISKRIDFSVGVGAILNSYSFNATFNDTNNRGGALAEMTWMYYMFNTVSSIKYRFKAGQYSDGYFRLNGGLHIDDFFDPDDSDERYNTNPDFYTYAELNNEPTFYISPELGLVKSTGGGKKIELGVSFRYVSRNMLDGFLESNNSRTTFRSKGQQLQLNIRYQIPFLREEKRSDRKERELQEEFESRPVATSESLKVKSKEIELTFWDSGARVDGDIISIQVNGEYVLRNYKLKAEKKTIQVTLEDGENEILMHAHNEGRHPPNTAAIVVGDGSRNQHVVLNADLESSGQLILTYQE